MAEADELVERKRKTTNFSDTINVKVTQSQFLIHKGETHHKETPSENQEIGPLF